MTEELDLLLEQVQALIAKGQYTKANEILKPLRNQHPLSHQVAKLWCSVALRTNQANAVLTDAEKFYQHASDDFRKAYWAHTWGMACSITLDLPSAYIHYMTALEHLLALAKSGKIPPQRKLPEFEPIDNNLFVSGKAEELLWATCAALAQAGVQAFPFAGTLLGLVRHERLLDFDKDLDIAVWTTSLPACYVELEKLGWIRTTMHIDYSNFRDYIHSELGITLDVCGLQAKDKQILGGFWLPDHPDEYQRVSIFPQFDLIRKQTAHGDVWFPKQPERILTAFYGDWRTPNPNWDTVVSALNQQKFTLLIRCYAYHRLIQRWLTGDLPKAWCYAHQIALKDPDDVLVLRSRQWLERAITRLNRDMPVWPRNQRQKRVYTRMVADLFHEGHVNFLREARALGTHLTVCVVSDERVVENKGKLPVMTQMERAAVVSACQHVDAVLTETPSQVTRAYMQQHGFDIYTFASASDQERQDKLALCADLPATMIHELDYTPSISTSDLVQRILAGAGYKPS